MKKRIITGLILAVLLIPFLLLANLQIFTIGVLFLVLGGTWEMVNMFIKSDINDSTSSLIENGNDINSISKVQIGIIYALSFFIFISVTSMWSNEIWQFYDVNLFKWYADSMSYVSVNIIVSIVILMMMVFSKKFDSKWTGRAFLILYYVALGFSSLVILRLLGRRFLVYLFLTTVMTDIFAYTFGMNFGKHKMAPKISPKKSWEGAIGGTVVGSLIASCFAIFYSNIFGWVQNINAFGLYNDSLSGTIYSTICDFGGNKALEVIVIIIITLLASIMGQIGDLVASKFKRDNDIKDYSNIFPGHGGILDRFDSSIFVSLFLVLVFNILMLI